MVIQKWTQLHNRHFWNDLKNIQVEGLDVDVNATAEQVFLKGPLQNF
jgi:hypothetical protein